MPKIPTTPELADAELDPLVTIPRETHNHLKAVAQAVDERRGTGRTSRMLREAIIYAQAKRFVVVVSKTHEMRVQRRSDLRDLLKRFKLFGLSQSRIVFATLRTFAAEASGHANVEILFDHDVPAEKRTWRGQWYNEENEPELPPA